jgi:hypothetical protein
MRTPRLFLIPTLAATAAISGGVAHAAETVNVPFAFTAQGHNFPGGCYSVEQNPGKHLVTLHQIKGTALLNWTVEPGATTDGDHILLNFGRSADGSHVLRSIKFDHPFPVEGSPFDNLPGRLVPVWN